MTMVGALIGAVGISKSAFGHRLFLANGGALQLPCASQAAAKLVLGLGPAHVKIGMGHAAESGIVYGKSRITYGNLARSFSDVS